MKVLKFAIFSIFCLSAVASDADEGNYDLPSIKTHTGQKYEGIYILKSDRYGLLFRHSKGIAKVDFENLSMNLRMMYQPLDESAPPEASVSMEEEENPLALLSGGEQIKLTAVRRITVPVEWLYAGHQNRCGPCHHYGYGWTPYNWPRHWPRFNPAHNLAIPEYRAAAVHDFLITTGLAPRPCGVRTYRLARSPYHRRYY